MNQGYQMSGEAVPGIPVMFSINQLASRSRPEAIVERHRGNSITPHPVVAQRADSGKSGNVVAQVLLGLGGTVFALMLIGVLALSTIALTIK